MKLNTFTAMEITASGLSAQRVRLNLTASNIANAETTRTPQGGPYRRKDPIFQTADVRQHPAEDILDSDSEFDSFLDASMNLENGDSAGDTMEERQVTGVKVSGIAEDPSPPRMKYDPGHPDADANGYVAMPNVNVVEEMVNMISASRAYEAGVTVLQSVKGMARNAINIGR